MQGRPLGPARPFFDCIRGGIPNAPPLLLEEAPRFDETILKLNLRLTPPMTPEQIRLIRASFALVAPRANTAARFFYERLFTLDPSLRPLFHTNLEQQGRKLMQMLAAAVALLDRPVELKSALESLGQRHVSYGVQEKHYDTVGAALLWTLSTLLEEELSPDACSAWSQLYTIVASTMKAAAARISPPSPPASTPSKNTSSTTFAAEPHQPPSPPLHPRSDCGLRSVPANA